MKIKILSNFAHIDLGMCKVGEVKDIDKNLSKQFVDSKLAEKVTTKKEVK